MTQYQVVLEPSAQSEFTDSLDWYAEKSVNAASGFNDEFIRSVSAIADSPYRWPNYFARLREFQMTRYPFTIVYLIDETARLIVIVSVFHQNRHPKRKYRPGR